MKLIEVERLRGLAILMVVISHWGFFLPADLSRTWSGVDLFFVISGFVITRSFLKTLPDFSVKDSILERLEASRFALRSFFTKRFYRILPLAFVIMATNFVLAVRRDLVQGVFPEHIKSFSIEALAFVAGTYNYSMHLMSAKSLGVFWSLTVEEHFYLVFPFLMIIAGTFSKRLFICVGLLCLVAFVLRPLNGFFTDDSLKWADWRAPTHLRCDAIMAGCIVAFASMKNWGHSFAEKSRFTSWIAVPVLFAILWMAPNLTRNFTSSLPYVSMWLAASGLVTIASWDKGLVFEIPVLKDLLAYFGSRSYAIYLSHRTVELIATNLLLRSGKPALMVPPQTTVLTLTILVLTTLVVSEILYQGVEKPFIAFGKKRLDRLQNTVVPAEQNPLVTERDSRNVA